jgi:anti-anti-sigma factor
MAIHVTGSDDGIGVVAVEGRIDTATARSVEQAINGLLDTGVQRVVVDFSNVTYVASAGIRALILAQRRAQQFAGGGGIQLAALTPNVQEIFSIAGLEQMFKFHKTVDDARASFRPRSAPES